MPIGAILGAASLGAGLFGSLTSKTPKYNMAAMNEALNLINKQYTDTESYYNTANQAFDEQFGTYKGQTMQNAVNALAGSGIYESPVSENQLNRTRTALGETYAAGKSELAGQKLAATSAIDQSKISYLQNLSNLQYNRAMAKQANRSSLYGTLGGLGAALLV